MKLFYSELSANPAYYSFGYSVYGELEPSDDVAALYAQGFLPFVGAKAQPSRMVYMARGSRVRVAEFTEHHYHNRVLRKVEKSAESVETIVHAKEDFLITKEFTEFILTFFKFRFGKEAMPPERLAALLASPLLTHIVEYRIAGKPAAYLLEVHTPSSIHTWYHAYAREYEDRHLGIYLYIDMLRRAKAAQKEYAYLGVTYGSWMRYKTNFQPLEYWDGREWVPDTKTHPLKKLLAADSLRVIAFTDPWREKHEPFYKAPYPFTSTFMELRSLFLIMEGFPRIFFILIVLAGCVALLFGFHILVR